MINTFLKPGVHEEKVSLLFPSDEPIEKEPACPSLSLLFFSNRSGSNLLGEHLRSTPNFAGFHEQLNWDTITNISSKQKLTSLAAYIDHVTSTNLQDAQTYGFKVSWDQAMMLHRRGLLKRYQSVNAIQIIRSSRLDQAISHLLATQTGRWTSSMSGSGNQIVEYDFQRIAQILRSISHQESMASLVSDVIGVRVLTASYDDVVNDPQSVVARIAVSSGLDLGDWNASVPKLKKQGSDLNEEFKRRFLEDLAAGKGSIGVIERLRDAFR